MRPVWTEPFLDDFLQLPEALQRRVLRKLGLLGQNLTHPSLRVKKLRGREGVYEGSVNMSYRFLFRIEGDNLILERIGPHKILDEV
jgi:mRNA interferase RelE/StbE